MVPKVTIGAGEIVTVFSQQDGYAETGHRLGGFYASEERLSRDS
ncbi:hypothetical protein JMJ77_0014902 [Colletotrichum scovillei]|uniref:Uncharacterized protein n=1 Tax=Colletotrichum scovillei TaxID=1209932 RepID=A0A9P7R0N3_9PEZI|nr:hypothetical protein JMJ77_0014902 [Colletotrichum scovillei]KAG7056516.1 hypothetical protein JMJ78_0000314 [Colletotrichum scovillei]KAG7066445.1 hypothetical protein JMJ76_0000306 [Colletotrichum scovillei]